MEPRIATLLGDPGSLERATLDPICLLPPPSLAPRRPHPVEPSPVGDEARANDAPHRTEYIGNEHIAPVSQAPPSRQKSGAPIAKVLNEEGSQALPALATALATTSAVPFSARLSDILHDSAQQLPNKRRKISVDGGSGLRGAIGNENAKLKLPQLPKLPKKTARRPRIPPLLQGLHQPPPLPPEGRLFPPITGEAGAFGREIGDRSGIDGTVGREKDQQNITQGITTITGTEGRVGNAKVDDFARPWANDKENQAQEKVDDPIEREASRRKHAKKRNKWSEQETKDLLLGVSKFGIGSWKKILNCPDFCFNQRTAVDLKDRFRTCCPGEGLKIRNPKTKARANEPAPKQLDDEPLGASGADDNSSQETVPTEASSTKSKQARKPRSDKHMKGSAELAEMGIEGPFFKSKRRERHEFTDQDDENLLKGFEKHKFVWHAIRNDKELGFNMRQPTDLRDRFRIRYPDKYAEAGYKLKPKDELMLKDKKKEEANSQDATDLGITSQRITTTKENESTTVTDLPSSAVTANASSNPDLRLRQPLISSFPSPFDDFQDLMSEDGEGNHSPIILNRNIFEWADANPNAPSANPPAGSTSVPGAFSLSGDFGFNLFPSMDGMHIDPRATLKLPPASMGGSTLSVWPSYTTGSNQLLTMPQSANTDANINVTTAVSAPPAPTNTSSSSSKQTMSALLRTPNLPTIVFPHVPVASARSAMHNLPPPADLLSGLDWDLRPEQPSAGFVFDDGLNMSFALPSAGSTLAPMMNGTARGLLGLDRVVLDEPFGERSVLNSGI